MSASLKLASVRHGVVASSSWKEVSRPYVIPAAPVSRRVVGSSIGDVICRTARLCTFLDQRATAADFGL